MMRLRLYHGRLQPKGPPSDRDGIPTEGEWGFDGPLLEGIDHVDFTYGEWFLVFATAEHYTHAKQQTCWLDGPRENSLCIENRPADLIRTHNVLRDNRVEYFGDFILEEVPC